MEERGGVYTVYYTVQYTYNVYTHIFTYTIYALYCTLYSILSRARKLLRISTPLRRKIYWAPPQSTPLAGGGGRRKLHEEVPRYPYFCFLTEWQRCTIIPPHQSSKQVKYIGLEPAQGTHRLESTVADTNKPSHRCTTLLEKFWRICCIWLVTLYCITKLYMRQLD